MLAKISERLKEIRKDKGLTQKQFGEILNLSQDTVSLWETDKSTPNAEQIINIALTFNVSSDYLLGLKEY